MTTGSIAVPEEMPRVAESRRFVSWEALQKAARCSMKATDSTSSQTRVDGSKYEGRRRNIG